MFASLVLQGGCPCCLARALLPKRTAFFKSATVSRYTAQPITKARSTSPPPTPLRLRGGSVVNPRDGSIISGVNVLVDHGRIVALETTGAERTHPSAQMIDATGKFIVPGYNDMHSHILELDDPSGALALLLAEGVTGFRQMSEREIERVAAYVRTLGRAAAVPLTGDAARGKALYETKGGCTACHIVGGAGGTVGPDLSEIGARRSAAYLRESLLKPGATVPDGYLVVAVTTRAGRQMRGVRVNEDSFTIQLREAGGAFHSFRKANLTELKKEFGASTMPSYEQPLSAAEIDDLVAWLASLRGEK